MSYSRGSVPIRRYLWQRARKLWASRHPNYERAMFGRYVGALGGTLSMVSAGRVAWVASEREKGRDGFSNKGYRRALRRYLARGGNPSYALALFNPPDCSP